MTMRSTILAAGVAAVALAGCSTMRTPSRDELVAQPSACAAKRFDIYFAEDQATLTDAARTAIGLTATQLQGCEIKTVRVLGLASSTGDADANQALSEQTGPGRRAGPDGRRMAGPGLRTGCRRRSGRDDGLGRVRAPASPHRGAGRGRAALVVSASVLDDAQRVGQPDLGRPARQRLLLALVRGPAGQVDDLEGRRDAAVRLAVALRIEGRRARDDRRVSGRIVPASTLVSPMARRSRIRANRSG